MTPPRRRPRDAVSRKNPPRRAFARFAGPVAHLTWAATVVGQVVGLGLYDESEDFGAGMTVWVVTGVLFGLVTTTVAVADAPVTTKRGRPGRPRPRTGRPWDAPAVWVYLATWVAVSLVTSSGEFAYGALVLVLAGSGGLCVFLAVRLEMICFLGLRGFGSALVGDLPPGEEGLRWTALGPFVATVGASLWFLPVVGLLGYDSPRSRDILPLVGVLRDGVEVTHPTLLLVGQVGTVLVLRLVTTGFLLTCATVRLRRGDQA